MSHAGSDWLLHEEGDDQTQMHGRRRRSDSTVLDASAGFRGERVSPRDERGPMALSYESNGMRVVHAERLTHSSHRSATFSGCALPRRSG